MKTCKFIFARENEDIAETVVITIYEAVIDLEGINTYLEYKFYIKFFH